ncbi:MAG: hypothetical protein HUU10_01100 [Bacteroidetes bacterium]|nr:hypothetical protein [Bacteroidota bacterium]
MILFLIFLIPVTASGQSGLAGAPGSWSRLGNSARSVAVGNAVIADTSFETAGFQSPALPALRRDRFTEVSSFSPGLDRQMHALYLTHPVGPAGAISYGLMYFSHGAIDIRNNNGEKTGSVSPWEAIGLVNFSLGLKRLPVTIGIGVKYRMSWLFEDVATASGFGIDAGAVWKTPVRNLTAAFVIQDMNAQYTWDTKDLYDEDGNTTIDYFPLRYRLGLSYVIQEGLVINGEWERWSWKNDVREFSVSNDPFPVTSVATRKDQEVTGSLFRLGTLWTPVRHLTFMTGLDRIASGESLRWSAGFRIDYPWIGPYLDFAVVADQQAPQTLFVLSAGYRF